MSIIRRLLVQKEDLLLPREICFPWNNTSQEKFLLSKCARRSRKLWVIHAFRGCRKTTSAFRAVSRQQLLHPATWRYFYLRLVHVETITSLEAELGMRFSDSSPKATPVSTAWTSFMKFVLSSLGVAAVGIVLVFLKDGYVSRENVAHHLKFPDKEEWVVFCIATCIAILLTFRRKVLIVDDVLAFQFGNTKSKADTAQMILDMLKQLPLNHYPIILLSSNEGIGRLFSDKNSTTFLQATFPAATPAELLAVLQRTVEPSISMDQFSEVQERHGMVHHLYSVRWWRIVLAGGEGIAALLGNRPYIPRATLREIALTLDLECQKVARSFALSYSPVVNVADALKMYFEPDEVKKIVEQYGTKGPRRLVLTAGLLVTGRDAVLRQQRCQEREQELQRELEEQEKVLNDAASKDAKKPTAETAQMVKAERMKLASLQKFAADFLSNYAPNATDREEWQFWNTVRREVVCLDERECFAKDDTCLHEIARIKRLVEGKGWLYISDKT